MVRPTCRQYGGWDRSIGKNNEPTIN
ncbi:hypothetical protein FMEAI12_4410010 [Parafrankia sp. Ea1.12]|nr:hypothetical protein FMEAI12_4410010 [Parafrankia sp. Ea1.12]